MTLEKRVIELRAFYGGISEKILPDMLLVRINKAMLPRGCVPQETDFLVIFPPGQDTPSGWFVKEKVRLPNGTNPNSASTTIDGEVWFSYSYRFSWSQSNDPMYQYVESALHRFAKQA